MASEDIIGEWALDAESCAESRLVFDIDGNHSSMVAGDDGWEYLATAAYQVDGTQLTITQGEIAERIQIVVQERDRLVLRNPESAMGDITTELVRCPAY
jgi:hypothetical protein